MNFKIKEPGAATSHKFELAGKSVAIFCCGWDVDDGWVATSVRLEGGEEVKVGGFKIADTANGDTAMQRYGTLIVDLALACSDVTTGENLKKNTKKLCVKHLDPTFRFSYPIKGTWHSKAEQAYKTFRSAYEKLLT